MNRYTIYCTEEQTRKALELGAPIEELVNHPLDKKICDKYHFLVIDEKCYNNPTAEQMVEWLEEQDRIYYIDILFEGKDNYSMCVSGDSYDAVEVGFASREEAILAAIDIALEYLSNNKK